MNKSAEFLKKATPPIIKTAALSALAMASVTFGNHAYEDINEESFVNGHNSGVASVCLENGVFPPDPDLRMELPEDNEADKNLLLFGACLVGFTGIAVMQVSSIRRISTSNKAESTLIKANSALRIAKIREDYNSTCLKTMNVYRETYTSALHGISRDAANTIEGFANGDLTPDEARINALEIEIRASNFELKPIEEI